MYDENQLVPIKWNNTNKDLYISKGYKFTKFRDIVMIRAKDLPPKSNVVLNVTCDYCGKEYTASNSCIQKGRKIVAKDCCKSCYTKKFRESKVKLMEERNTEKVTKICEEHGYTLISISDNYTTAKNCLVTFSCPIHGEQTSTMMQLLAGYYCKECGEIKRTSAKKLSQEKLIATIEADGNRILNPNDYRNCGTRNLKIQCACGNVFTTSYNHYTNMGIDRCKVCSSSESKGERAIRRYLEDNNINYIAQKSFDDCKDKHRLPFDFYLPDFNTAIEFDGLQHFKPIHGNDVYLLTVLHDQIKNIYCSNNRIELMRIPYWDEKNIVRILDNRLYR